MERTLKIKIALGVLLVLLAVRFILGFFPTPLEFTPYAPTDEEGTHQTITFSEIRHVMTFTSETGKVTHYYLVKTTDGKEAYVSSANKYIDETFEEPVTFTGIASNLLDPKLITPQTLGNYYARFSMSEDLLAKYGGNAESAYQALSQISILNSDFDDTTAEHPAARWFSFAAFAVFCVLLALLLKEYAGARRTRKE